VQHQCGEMIPIRWLIVAIFIKAQNSFRLIHPNIPQFFKASSICGTIDSNGDTSIRDTNLRKNVELYKGDLMDVTSKFSYSGYSISKPEVLSPAGGWPQLIAACNNGADAVYFGLQEGFNARSRASNFAIDELDSVIAYLHDRNVKGYVVVNILIFDEEMEELEKVIRRLAISGVDALIMQDIGAIELARKVAPNLPIHGSTQMSITDSHGADFAIKNLGIERVVVGRELSLEEITSVASRSEAEVEAFVHGALCVSYSGQCFSSEAWGGRSANRGQCAQACRMPYGLVVNGTLKDLYDVQYLLSPQDLMAVDVVPQLILAGVRSLKIEGRLKGAEYVAVTTRAYREAVDEAWQLVSSHLADDPSSDEVNEELAASIQGLYEGPTDEMRRDLKQVFSRGQDEQFDGLSPGFLLGVRHQSLVRGRNPRHRGLLLGRVSGITGAGEVRVALQPELAVKRGDGVVFDRGQPQQVEQGGSVYQVFNDRGESVQQSSGAMAVLAFGRGAVDVSHISVGDLVWRNKDAELDAKLRRWETASRRRKFAAVQVSVGGRRGHPLKVTVSCGTDGRMVVGSAFTNSSLTMALKRPTSREDIAQAIGTLGDTPFEVSLNKDGLPSIDWQDLQLHDCDGGEISECLFIPVAEVKAARRLAIQRLLEARRLHSRSEGMPQRSQSPHSSRETARGQESYSPSEVKPELSLLCRTPQQVEAACSVPWLQEVVLDFLEVHGLRESLQTVRASGKRAVVATPRIIKPDEDRLVTFYLRLRADALLVRSSGFLQQLLEMGGPGAEYAKSGLSEKPILIPQLHGDFSLNAANVLGAGLLLQSGLSRLAPTHDLNAVQIADLATHLQEFGNSGQQSMFFSAVCDLCD